MKIALVQSALAWGDVDGNLRNFERKLEENLGVDLIILPEMFTSGCVMVKKSREVMMAEKAESASRYEEVCGHMREWAARQDALVMGSTICREEDRYYNRLVVAFPNGEMMYYDKRHCFRMGGENEHFMPGKQQLVFDFRGVRIAAFVCYDLRFPVWCRNTQGYDLAVFAANWPASRREVWNTLLKARAIENQAYIAGVNCAGTDPYGLRYAGDSALVDARGNLVVQASEYVDEIVITDCDTEALYGFRNKFNVLGDRDQFNVIVD